jgi:hypothetical protein
MSLEFVIKFDHTPRVAPNARRFAAAALNTAVMTTIQVADPLTPVDTGLLKGNKAIVVASAGSLEASVDWVQEYGVYQNFGTRFIAPKLFANQGVQAAEHGLVRDIAAIGGKLIS